MNFRTKQGGISVALGAFDKKHKADFFRLLDSGGYTGDLNKAWKDYQDASLKAAKSSKRKKK